MLRAYDNVTARAGTEPLGFWPPSNTCISFQSYITVLCLNLLNDFAKPAALLLCLEMLFSYVTLSLIRILIFASSFQTCQNVLSCCHSAAYSRETMISW